MTREAFERWWDSDDSSEGNEFRLDSPAWWAWEGWQAAKDDSAPVLAALRALVNEPQDAKAYQDSVKLLVEIDGEGRK